MSSRIFKLKVDVFHDYKQERQNFHSLPIVSGTAQFDESNTDIGVDWLHNDSRDHFRFTGRRFAFPMLAGIMNVCFQ